MMKKRDKMTIIKRESNESYTTSRNARRLEKKEQAKRPKKTFKWFGLIK